jgi:hypothetical protein
MNCIDTDTALTVVQSLGDEADRHIKHLATCPACSATLADVSLLSQSFRTGSALSEETIQYIYRGIRAAPQDADAELISDNAAPRPLLAGATFLAVVLTVLGIGLFPGLHGIFNVVNGFEHIFWAHLVFVVLIAKFVTWPELLHPFTRARIWRTQLKWR